MRRQFGRLGLGMGMGGGVSTAPAPSIPILDVISNVIAAYSFRRLSSTYDGPVVKIRRSSDNALQTFGLIGDVVDTAAIATFVGGGTGFVQVFYDHTGNNNFMRSTAPSLQPIFEASGAGGFPIARFDGTDDKLITETPFGAAVINAVGNYTESAVFTDFPAIISKGSAGSPSISIFGNVATTDLLTNAAGTYINSKNTLEVGTLSDLNVFSLNSLVAGVLTDNWNLGQERVTANRYWGGDVAEAFIFSAIDDVSRVKLEVDQGTAYDITMAADKPFDMYLAIGQSNMGGSDSLTNGTGTQSLGGAGLQTAADKETFFTYNTAGTLVYDTAADQFGAINGHLGKSFGTPGFFVHGPEVSFTRDARTDNVENPAIIKFAANFAALEGGVSPWVKGKSLYTQMAAFVNSSIAELESRGYTVNIKGFIWAQGIDDGALGRTQVAYSNDLTQIISDLRGDYGTATTPFVLMRSVDSPIIGSPAMAPIRAGQVAVADADPSADWINVDDLTPYVNSHHLSSDSQITSGERFYAAFSAL